MGFSSLIAQTMFFIMFLVLTVSTLNVFSEQSRSSAQSMSLLNKRVLDLANTDVETSFSYYNTTSQTLSVRLENQGQNSINTTAITFYVDDEYLPKNDHEDRWTICDTRSGDNKCGEVGYGDYSWENVGLIGLWHFNEDGWDGTAGEIADASGYNHDASAFGTANTTGNGVYVRAADMTGGYADITHAGTLNTIDEFTVSWWMRFEGTPGTEMIIRKSNECTAASKQGWDAYLSGTTVSLRACDGATVAETSLGDIAADKWVLVTYVYNTTHIAGYVDGTLRNAEPYTGTPDSTSNLQVGYSFDGFIDEVALWNQSLSSDQIQRLYLKQVEYTNPQHWDNGEYLEADIPLSLSIGTHRLKMALSNGYTAATTVVVD